MDDAYDINYDGAGNKLRSVIGVKENAVKLSNQLYSRMLKYWLGKKKLDASELNQLSRFYQGRNMFEYARTWERALTLLIGTNQIEQCKKHYINITKVIQKLQPYSLEEKLTLSNKKLINDSLVVSKAKTDLQKYLDISLSSALSYESLATRIIFTSSNKRVLNKKALEWAAAFRGTFMLRHQFVRWPLLEYISSEMNIVNFEPSGYTKSLKSVQIGSFEYAPRFIYYHEFALLLQLISILSENKASNTIEIIDGHQKHIKSSSLLPTVSSHDNTINVELGEQTKKQNSILNIGIANIVVSEKDIEASYKPNGKPNYSLQRQDKLFQIINEGNRKPKCDLIVLPEASIPFMWLPFMANISRKNKIGLAFGLEHLVINNIAFNLTVTILPYKAKNGSENCFISTRVKNYYSPEEVAGLKKYGYKIPDSKLYEKFNWRNCWLSVYNCFELTNINDRAIFKSELDLLVSIVLNKDINYYSNIIESVSRDLHLFVAQANTSDFGDSRIVAPKRTEEKDIIRVKGGINPVLLKGEIDVSSLRNFQVSKYNKDDKRFKPTPAGFDKTKAQNRGS